MSAKASSSLPIEDKIRFIKEAYCYGHLMFKGKDA